MVDPKETNERTVRTESLDQSAPKVWVKPRLATGFIDETEATAGAGHPSDGVASCLS